MKNICPVIGMISSGKSSILNAIFNIDYLEVKAEVTTKIVTIIRYSPSATNPRFFHLIVNNEGNDNYSFTKEKNTEIVGKEVIKNQIKELNEKFSQEKPIYEKLFYMLEIGEVNLIQKEFLRDYDFADIPGVSENTENKNLNPINEGESAAPKANISEEDLSLTAEEECRKTNPEKEVNYLTQIYKILKNKINNGIIVLSADKFQNIKNYTIIGTLQKVLDKPIENFLILLNKMDKSDDIKNDLDLLNEKFSEEFPEGTINATRNTVVQCSSFQIENELRMENSFPNLIYYHYINYIMESKRFNDFIGYLINFLKNFEEDNVENIKKTDFEKNLKSIENDKNILKIINIIPKIRKNHSTLDKNL